ncbi:MAG: cobyrinate a,c-diamide synthase [Spirochaetaceae bacterium]
MKRILIAGTKSGVGKTTVSMGIMAALSKKMNVQPYKVGPDYIDSAYHSYITGNICSNLDSYLLDKQMIEYLFVKNSRNKDIAIIEGVMGLFDGAEIKSDIGTSASIAKILNTPIILVVDGSGVASSIAATIKGFEVFDPDTKITGVIINNVGSRQHYELLKSAIEYHTTVIPCGYLIRDSVISLPERHLGLVPACEQIELETTFKTLANQVESTIDLDKIIKLSESTVLTDFPLFELKKENPISLRVAIAKDSAFNFYYQDSLDILSEMYNIMWIPYSPISDRELPKNIHGLYLGGGFPEVFAKEISENREMKSSLLKNLNNGLPYIAECGGLMYLGETLIDLHGLEYSMVGWFKGYSKMTQKLQRFGYASLTQNNNTIKIHEFHRSESFFNEKTVYKLEKRRENKVIQSWNCGYTKGAGIAGYAHFHFGSNLTFANDFVNKCLEYKKVNKS